MLESFSLPNLKSTAQYDRWFIWLRNMAIAYYVWEFIDLDSTDEKELDKPTEPTPYEAKLAVWQRRQKRYAEALAIQLEYAASGCDTSMKGDLWEPYPHPGDPPERPDPNEEIWEEDLTEVEAKRLHASLGLQTL